MPTFADPQLAAFVAGLAAAPPMSRFPVERLRQEGRQRAESRPAGPEMARVVDLDVAGRAARLYQPAPAAHDVVLYLHGGGWTIGDLETHDRVCRRFAAAGAFSVLALDYRLAPEHPHPAAVDDCEAALRFLRGAAAPGALGLKPAAVGAAGDSAGGTLAALAALRLRAEPTLMPQGLLLLYANTDLSGSGQSMIDKASGFGLNAVDVEWFNQHWVPDRRRWRDPDVSPLFAPELSGLPETLIITCEHDPLRDQGEAFGARLQASGVTTTVRRLAGMVHNFMLWDLQSPACARAADRAAVELAALLARHRAP
jgi:acetyl esterase